MVIRTLWPGATAEQVDRQITDRIEKKLQETPHFKWTQSHSKPGESLIVLELLDTAPARDVPAIWYQVRKKLGDIRHTLPPEAQGPFFNDEFGDVYGSIYAFTADGFTLSELRDYVERVRQEVLRLPDVAKVELVGVQDDRIYVELSSKRIAALGIDPQMIGQALAAQNAMLPPGSVETRQNSVALRVTGQLDSVQRFPTCCCAPAARQSGSATLRRCSAASSIRP
jgi:multidrug efflux pump